MRHFHAALRARDVTVHSIALDDAEVNDDAAGVAENPTLAGRLERLTARLKPQRLRLVEPGEWRVEQAVKAVAERTGVELQLLDDTHFHCSKADFARWAGPRAKALRMEFFYREMRRTHRVLPDETADKESEPEGGRWNFDAENRQGWPKSPASRARRPHRACRALGADAITREVIALVEARFAEHPGLARRLRLGGDARAGAAGARDLRRHAPRAFRRPPGRDGVREPRTQAQAMLQNLDAL